MTASPVRGTVALLAAQAVALGLAAALLVIPANGIFLPAFGARWLPLTYVGIAALGIVASSSAARSLRRWPLTPVAVAILASMAAVVGATWALIAFGGVAWPSVVQLVLFPILLQLGFVIIGAQAGRLLDIQQLKAHFPRIVAGFVVGFAIGGFAAAPLLRVLGSPEDLSLLSAATLLAFLALTVATAARRRSELATVGPTVSARRRVPLRTLLAAPLVVVVFAYQVLSAMGSQVLDFLVFDRAAARYPGADDLSRFVAIYTGVLNVVDIAFLTLAAGWLLRRFGLRLGLTANPTFVTALTFGVVVAAVGGGAASLALFSFAVTARVADLTLTDGMTRTSVNAVYQVLPVDERMAVQATVEGVGVPIAIGATGVLLLVLDALGLGTVAITVFALVLCAAWGVAAFVAYASYRRALGTRLRRQGLDLAGAAPVSPDEQAAARRLLVSGEGRDVRLGLDLADPDGVAPADLADLATDADADVRLLALGQLAARGDEAAAATARDDVAIVSQSTAVFDRRAAAMALAGLPSEARADLLGALLVDADPTVRRAALGSVGAADADLLSAVVAGLGDAATSEAALAALGRLGGPVLALAATRLAGPGPARGRDLTLLRAARSSPAEAECHLAGLVEHPDRDVSAAVLHALARSGATVDPLVAARLLVDDAALVARLMAARAELDVEADGALCRALDDVEAMVRERVLAVLAVRYEAAIIEDAGRALRSPDPARRALGVELLDVSLTGPEATIAPLVLRDDLVPAERLRRLATLTVVPAHDRGGWLADLALDPEHRWASPWLQAVALHTEARWWPGVAAGHAAELDGAADPVLAETVAAARRSASGNAVPDARA